MDTQTLGAALALAKATVLPAAAAGDVGDVLTVDAQGAWVKGTPTGAVITVSGTTLTIAQEGDS